MYFIYRQYIFSSSLRIKKKKRQRALKGNAEIEGTSINICKPPHANVIKEKLDIHKYKSFHP